MPVYATDRSRLVQRRSAPQAMLFIIAGHFAVIALVMSARMDIPQRIRDGKTIVDLIPDPEPPPPEPLPQPKPQPAPNHYSIDRMPVVVPVPAPDPVQSDPMPMPVPNPGPLIGNAVEPVPQPRLDPLPIPQPRPAPVRTGPRFATPDSALRPPYPSSKIHTEEEAVLRLRLSIGADGRVTAVDPVGAADPVFLAAARRHLVARWRYKPATEDGRAVASSTVITLRFELD